MTSKYGRCHTLPDMEIYMTVHIYQAGEQTAGVTEKIKRRLFSYYYNKKNPNHINEAYNLEQDLFLDSGSYTSWTKGVTINPEEYATFIHEHKHKFNAISNIDDITDPKISYDNLKILESLGVKPNPVYHFGEDPYWLKKYMDEGYDYIFIGGLVPQSTKDIILWMDDLWPKHLCNPDGTSRIRTHAFGVTTIGLLVRYPFYSADSASWLFTGAMGNCSFLIDNKLCNICFSSDSPIIKNANASHYENLPQIVKYKIDEWLDCFGVTAQQCAEHYKYRNIVNVATYQEMESLGATTFKKQQMSLF